MHVPTNFACAGPASEKVAAAASAQSAIRFERYDMAIPVEDFFARIAARKIRTRVD